jgi:hypothetical protein
MHNPRQCSSNQSRKKLRKKGKRKQSDQETDRYDRSSQASQTSTTESSWLQMRSDKNIQCSWKLQRVNNTPKEKPEFLTIHDNALVNREKPIDILFLRRSHKFLLKQDSWLEIQRSHRNKSVHESPKQDKNTKQIRISYDSLR